jgi:YD repeat-containing protein
MLNSDASGNVSVAYDNNFRVTSRSVGATPVNYTYDADGLLTSVKGVRAL